MSRLCQAFLFVFRIAVVLPIVILGLMYCVAPKGASALATNDGGKPQVATVPVFSHEVLVILENHSYSEVVGNRSMPYFNSLIRSYGLATKYYANTHPSIGNYFMLTTGQMITRNDNFGGTVAVDTITHELTAAGKTWKVYAEGLSQVGYRGPSTGHYLKRHNPIVYFSEVQAQPQLQKRIVPFAEFSKDASAGKLPQFSLVIPDACHDAHDCSLAVADRWLKQQLSQLVSNKRFLQNSLFVLVFDEGKERDVAHGGGRDPVVLVSALVKPGFRSPQLYQHQNLLRTLLQGLGVEKFPGLASTAVPMADFFTNVIANPSHHL